MFPLKHGTWGAAALACAAVLVAAGCSAGGGRTTTQHAHDSADALAWHTCTVSGAGPMQCASLRVPLDYSHPDGRKITLALSMVPATAPTAHRQGDLLVNPGGPGGSGLGLASDVAFGLDHTVASEYNIIGFDPRGVGSSVPALHCDPSFFSGVRPDYIPASRQAEQALIARAHAYAASCEHRFGWLLPFMTTMDAARDMDSIRAALGQQKISYFGYSYGTYLGQVYATLFPQRLRRMVLDSTVDPAGVWYADNISQDYAFQGRMEAFFAWVASHDAVYHLGASQAQVQRAWYEARADVGAHPVAGPGGPMIGSDEFDDTFLQGGYSDTLWPELASALTQYLHNRATRLMILDFKALGAQNENEFAVYNAVECSDVNWPRNWAKWDSDTRRVDRTAPFQAWDNAWFNAACAFWPVRGPAQPLQIRGAGLPGILMIQGTLDAATPYQGAQVAHQHLPTARMVVVEGGGNHGQSLTQPPNTCVNGFLNRYLATGALPTGTGPVDARCAALSAPSPNL
ncbi:MAG TPA: alpha/beta hydrolase [Streptosporangiaceae bacterium]|nr:alpha/beta hydrolase [Streptosporangiaceae bacterium]